MASSTFLKLQPGVGDSFPARRQPVERENCVELCWLELSNVRIPDQTAAIAISKGFLAALAERLNRLSATKLGPKAMQSLLLTDESRIRNWKNPNFVALCLEGRGTQKGSRGVEQRRRIQNFM
jgi:hypothetical protein